MNDIAGKCVWIGYGKEVLYYSKVKILSMIGLLVPWYIDYTVQ